MSGLAGIVAPGVSPGDLDGSLAAIGHREPERSRLRRGSDAVMLVSPGGACDGGELLVACHGRIDETDQLAERLGVHPESTPAALVGAAYRRWGPELGDHLVGDYAIAIWDSERWRLTLLRDASGSRPLVYRLTDGGCWFGSEVEQLCAPATGHQPVVDDAGLAAYLVRHAPALGTTCIAGVRSVAPGSTVVLALGVAPSFHRHRWVDAIEVDPGLSLDTAAGELRSRLRTAVERRTTDEVALLLSGGVDSGSVAGALGHIGPPAGAAAYTWAFPPGPGREVEPARIVAGHVGLPIHEVATEDHPPFADLLDGPIRLEAPTRWPFAGLHDQTYRCIAERGHRTLMSGWAGDELVGGPVWDRWGYLRNRPVEALRWELAPVQLRRRLGAVVSVLRPEAPSRSLLGARLSDYAPTPVGRRRPMEARRALLFGPHAAGLASLGEAMMARHGLAAVDPWGDREVVELVLSVPPHLAHRPGDPKRLARAAAAPDLPAGWEPVKAEPTEQVVGAPRRLRSLFLDLVDRSQLVECGYVAPAAIEPLRRAVVDGLMTSDLERFSAAEAWVRRWGLAR